MDPNNSVIKRLWCTIESDCMCAQWTDQPTQSDQCLQGALLVANDPERLQADSEVSDQPAQMRRMI